MSIQRWEKETRKYKENNCPARRSGNKDQGQIFSQRGD